ncbi:glycosyltransferase [Patescibacteria group bacterium]
MKYINKKRILFVSGSTAGHVWPAVWVAKYLQTQKPDTECYFYISGSSIEKKILKDQNFKYTKVFSGKWRKYFSLLNFIDIFKNIFGFFQSILLLVIYRPRVVFIKGGFLGVPIAFASTILGIPYVNHESDAQIGLANKLISKHSKKIYVAFPKYLYGLSSQIADKTESVGIPLASEFSISDKLNKDINTILFLGGSLGSKKINDNLKPILKDLLVKYKIIHICGQNNFQEFQKIKSNLNKEYQDKYNIYGFVESGLSGIMKSSDLVISRAGATTVFELASLGKPVIFIPLGKKVSRGDQIHNCKFIQGQNAGVVINDVDLTSEKLQREILNLANNPDKIQSLSENIQRLVTEKSEQKITNYLIKYL